MWVRKEGKATAMDKPMTLENGTKVNTDGTYTTKDGKTMKLQNGECLDKKGNLIKAGETKKEEKKDAQPQQQK